MATFWFEIVVTCSSLYVFAGHSCYKASEEIANVVKDVIIDVFNGVWCFYMLCVFEANKHSC